MALRAQRPIQSGAAHAQETVREVPFDGHAGTRIGDIGSPSGARRGTRRRRDTPGRAPDPSSAKTGIPADRAGDGAGDREQAAHQAAAREVHQVRLRAGRDVRPLVVSGPMTAGAGAAALVATFAETAIPQRPGLRRPVHGVAGSADPARLRVQPVAVHGLRARSPAGRDPCRRPWIFRRGRGSTAGRSRRRPCAGSSSPLSRPPRSRRPATSGAGRDRSRRRSSRPAVAGRRGRTAADPARSPAPGSRRPDARARRRPRPRPSSPRRDRPRRDRPPTRACPPASAVARGRRRAAERRGRCGSRAEPVSRPRFRQIVRRPLDGGLRRRDSPCRARTAQPPSAPETSCRRPPARRRRDRTHRTGSSGAGRGSRRSRRFCPPSPLPRGMPGETALRPRRRLRPPRER